MNIISSDVRAVFLESAITSLKYSAPEEVVTKARALLERAFDLGLAEGRTHAADPRRHGLSERR